MGQVDILVFILFKEACIKSNNYFVYFNQHPSLGGIFFIMLKCINKFVAITLSAALWFFLATVFTYAEEPNSATITANILNLREAPDTSSKVLGQLTKGTQLKVIDSTDGWYKVSENGKTGWVSAAYVAFTNLQTSDIQSGTITGNNVNVRNGPGLSYAVITQQNKGARVSVLEISQNWCRVKTSDGIKGWIISTYINVNSTSVNNNTTDNNKTESIGNIGSVKTPQSETGNAIDSSITNKTEAGHSYDPLTDPKTANGKTSNSSTDSAVQTDVEGNSGSNTESQTGIGNEFLNREIVEYAESFLGVKYSYGGTTPDTGFDCSGFTKYVFEKFGIQLERIAADQAEQGNEVLKDELLPGDLIFSDTDGGNNNITHVGIYIGDGLFINAASGSSSGKVIISDLNSSYWQKTYMMARRVLK